MVVRAVETVLVADCLPEQHGGQVLVFLKDGLCHVDAGLVAEADWCSAILASQAVPVNNTHSNGDSTSSAAIVSCSLSFLSQL